MNNTYVGSDMRRAFTLLELIICITVLLTLLAILLPVFFQIKKNANKITTFSNIRQLGFAWRMYISDYDDTLMRSVVLGNHWWGDNKGKGMLSPYINLSTLSDPSLKYYKLDDNKKYIPFEKREHTKKKDFVYDFNGNVQIKIIKHILGYDTQSRLAAIFDFQ